MSVRFRKSVKILPGVRVNLSKSGPSLSIGGGGLTLNYSKQGVRTTADLPGGLYYTKLHGDADEKTAESKTEQASTEETVSQKLDTDFFDRVRMSEDEEQFVKGLKEFAAGNAETALSHLSQATDIPDGAFLAGAVALSLEKYTESLQYLEKAAAQKDKLGERFKKYGVSSEVEVPITEEISVLQEADERGLILLLAEAYQHTGNMERATDAMRELLKLIPPEDIVARLSLVEMLSDSKGDDVETCKEIIALVGDIPNETPFHTMLLLYKARALRKVGLNDIAKKTLSDALRRTKDRSTEVLNTLRYERAILLEAMGQKAAARKDLETIFASDPHFEDVAERLNISA
ncbi:MAG: hypothetical protein BroJett018_32020 [Chloroflexota bacterium]|nr:DUF4236 domain-containing protein [Chloroflexota bacterium]NOG65983.1 DUF4236 domain-containing protein [Chloroflexota bacterium]GIK65408.1 MAG: hypothetical protein BroJett018_32020 [Chloroflexota bacterium]